MFVVVPFSIEMRGGTSKIRFDWIEDTPTLKNARSDQHASRTSEYELCIANAFLHFNEN